MSTRPSFELERLPLRESELERGAPSPALFLPDIGPTVPHAMMSSPSTVENSGENSENSSESSESSSESERGEMEEEEEEEQRSKKGKVLLGKRRRSRPVKFSAENFVAASKRKKRTPRLTKTPTLTSTDPKITKRGRACGVCEGCKKEDCRTCTFCLDKPKFGGPGRKKQRCENRPCSNFQHKRSKKDLKKAEAAANDSSTTEEVSTLG